MHTKYIYSNIEHCTPSLGSKVKGHHQTLLFQFIGEGLQHTPRLTHQHSCTKKERWVRKERGRRKRREEWRSWWKACTSCQYTNRAGLKSCSKWNTCSFVQTDDFVHQRCWEYDLIKYRNTATCTQGTHHPALHIFIGAQIILWQSRSPTSPVFPPCGTTANLEACMHVCVAPAQLIKASV